jgi:hypothetical protein
MGLIQNVRNIFTQTPDPDKQVSVSGTNYGGAFGVSVASSREVAEIFEFLDNCGQSYHTLAAKEQAKLSILTYENFPFAKRAIGLIVDMVGNVEIESIEPDGVDNKDLSRLNELAKRLPILTEYTPNNPNQYGVNSYAKRLCRAMLLHGMQFTQDRYEGGDVNSYQGAMLFNPVNFDYLYTGNEYELFYRFYMGKPIEKSTFFDFVGWDFRENEAWAHPLISGGRMFTRMLLAMLSAAQNISLRKGFPIDVNLIGAKFDEKLIDAKTKESYAAFITAMRDKVEQGIENQFKGKATSIVGSFPADINLMNQAFGAAFVKEVDVNLLNMMFIQFANILEVPPEVLGLVMGSGLSQTERFKLMYKFLGGKVDDLRETVNGTIHMRLLNYFRFCGESPQLLERIKPVFQNIETKDEKEQAEIDKTVSETNRNHVQVADSLWNGGMVDEEGLANYLERYGVVES